ncbi:hypothetical protein BN1708_020273, partial [Verticillium longisporum]
QQGRPSLHGSAVPRPQTAPGASLPPQVCARPARQRRLPPSHHCRCRYRSRWPHGRHEADQALRREGCRWHSH